MLGRYPPGASPEKKSNFDDGNRPAVNPPGIAPPGIATLAGWSNTDDGTDGSLGRPSAAASRSPPWCVAALADSAPDSTTRGSSAVAFCQRALRGALRTPLA